jgi:hypothetical protein
MPKDSRSIAFGSADCRSAPAGRERDFFTSTLLTMRREPPQSGCATYRLATGALRVGNWPRLLNLEWGTPL